MITTLPEIDDNGNLLFSEKDWLQPSQVKSLFGSSIKMKKNPKKGNSLK